MKIIKKDSDKLNSIISISLEQNDFADKVLKILKDYQKKANIPGFRKGHVPMGLVKKQYENAVTADEVNKLLQEKLSSYIKDEKIEILGNPLPKLKKELDWKSPEITFEFEIGLAPNFDLNLKSKKKVTYYKIEADPKMITNQVEYLQKQYGKLIPKTDIKNNEQITIEFDIKENQINKSATIELKEIKSTKIIKLLKSSKVSDKIQIPFKGLFKSENDYSRLIGKPYEEIKDLIINTTIKEINYLEPAKLDQNLFDKAYKNEKIKSLKELKSKIKIDSEKQFENQSDQKLLNDVNEFLISINNFDLPKKFLVKWIQTSGDKPLDKKEANEEFLKSEKGIRYQLIEAKIIKLNNLEIKFEELKSFAKEMIKNQMAQYGQTNPEEKELDKIAARIFTNKEETKRLSDQLMSKNLLEFYKKNISFKNKKLSYDSFIKEVYGSKQ